MILCMTYRRASLTCNHSKERSVRPLRSHLGHPHALSNDIINQHQLQNHTEQTITHIIGYQYQLQKLEMEKQYKR